MALKHSYSLLSPIYDLAVRRPLDQARRNSLARLQNVVGKDILINGIGTGLDIAYLPHGASYKGSDITPLMLKRAEKRAEDFGVEIELETADSLNLPYRSESFDAIVMHLILAVVPDPARALQEAERVLRNKGSIYIFDKFLKPGQIAPIRRTINTVLRHIATRTDVVFEELLPDVTRLHVVSDDPALAGGWFRLIELTKKH